jgi:hypothetical protein
VSIYNLLGQELTTLINEHQAAGSYTLAWDGSQFASGIYLCRMITDKNFSETRKLVLLR